MPQMSDLVLDDTGDREPQCTRRDLAPGHRIMFETIEREILDGRLRPDDRLPSETALADRPGVHRLTTCEGLRLLEEAASCSVAAAGACLQRCRTRTSLRRGQAAPLSSSRSPSASFGSC